MSSLIIKARIHSEFQPNFIIYYFSTQYYYSTMMVTEQNTGITTCKIDKKQLNAITKSRYDFRIKIWRVIRFRHVDVDQCEIILN